MKIKDITAYTILNSLGEWTIEVTLTSESQKTSLASVPQGKSTGKLEAHSVHPEKAVENVKNIKEKLINNNFESLEEFDAKLIDLDGSKNKSNLGGNTTLSLSIAFLKTLAKEEGIETYECINNFFEKGPKIPYFNLLIFEGGEHGSHLLTIQEFMLVTKDIKESQKIISKFKKYLDKENLFVGYGLEGAFTSSKLHDIQVLDLLQELAPNKKIALDVAESSREGDAIDFRSVIEKYNIFSLEDPKNEEDYKGWKEFYKNFGNKIFIVGDDLTTSNKTLIKNAQEEKMANAVIIKPNQIGTVSETIESVKQARKEDWKITVSHRGGDTNDDFIADFAVGCGADFVKFGGLQRGERIAKYNRINKIKKHLNS